MKRIPGKPTFSWIEDGQKLLAIRRETVVARLPWTAEWCGRRWWRASEGLYFLTDDPQQAEVARVQGAMWACSDEAAELVARKARRTPKQPQPVAQWDLPPIEICTLAIDSAR